MSLELFLAISIKLFIDNGRIHWRDLVNDFFFWVPGVTALDGDGLTRECEDVSASTPERQHDHLPMPLPAK